MSTLRALALKSCRSFRNTSRILETQSALKVVFVTVFALLFEAGLFALFYDGLRFLNSFEGLGSLVIGRLFSLFFLGMGLMLVVSGVVTAYSTIFRSEEVPFLLARPFGVSEIVSYKFLEATGLSSWAFFFIIIPFVGAYGWFNRIPMVFALWTLLFSVPFLFLCSGIGTLVTLAVVRWVPRGRVARALGFAFAGAVCFGVAWASHTVRNQAGEVHFSIARLVPGLSLASNALIPSWWVSEGIVSLARGQWMRGVLLWATLASTAGVVFAAVEALGSRTFYESWQRVVGRKTTVERASLLFAGLARAARVLPHDVRALLLKDLRTFFRDPVQWSQAVIFFGLLGLYFANLRAFNYHAQMDHWRNMLGFLNVFSVAAVMCSLSARFVYPQLSLEGQGFWIVGLSPTTMTRVLIAKFGMAFGCMLVIGVALVTLSASMLDLEREARVVSTALVVAVSLAVCGLATGLGAVFLDLRQCNPSAIVSGFGGTLNLVISLGFMLAAILPFSLLFHLRSVMKLTETQVRTGLLASSVWLAAITLLTAGVPLWVGARSLKKRDY